MTRAYVKKPRPQRAEYECSGCDGKGATASEDYDEHGSHIVMVRCEMCLGLGHLVDCAVCDECTPVPELEINGGRCGACAAGFEQGDARAEIARIQKWVA